MRIVADILILLGAPILTLGFDLVIVGRDSPVGGPLGVIASLIGSMLLTGGILQHYRLAVRARTENGKNGEATAAGRRGETSTPR
jgi:hypothetical protein